MKKNILIPFLILFFTGSLFSITYTSSGVGPAKWHLASSWSPNGIPTPSDDVVILSGHTIELDNSVTTYGYCNNLQVDGTLFFYTTGNLVIYGDITVNGSQTGNGNINFSGTSSPLKSLSGSGSYSANTIWVFVKDRIINSNVNTNRVATTRINSNITVRNSGNIQVKFSNLSSGAKWIQEANSSLTINIEKSFFTGIYQNIGTFDCSAIGNTVTINYFDGDIPNTVSGYYNLIITYGGNKKLQSNTTVINDLIINRTPSNGNINTLNANNFDLNIGHNFTLNTGTKFNPSLGKTLNFNGSSPQTITNNSTILALTNLSLNNSLGLSLSNGTYSLSEALTINDGTFNTGGRTFTLLSTASQTARIAPVSGSGAISGNFTVQRFITARDTTWSCMASPVINTTVQDWDNELFINYSTDPYQATVLSYDESIADYTPASTASTTISPMQGFEVYLTASTSLTNISNITLNTIGVPNVGDQSMALSYTNGTGYEGQNLVGNPFASSIDWSTVYSASSNIDNYADVFDYTTGNYASVNLGDEIGTGQGFWVYALGAGATLNIPESAKTTSSNSSLRSGSSPLFNLTLASADGSHSLAHKLELTSNNSFDNAKDANDRPYRTSLNNKAPKITALVDGKEFVRNAFSSDNKNYDLPLTIQVGIEGKYAINASNMDMVNNDYSCITLEDKKLNQVIDLNSTTTYAFFASPNDSKDRFQLHFSKDGNCKTMSSTIASAIENQVQILPTINGNSIAFNFEETLNTTVVVTNLLGQSIVEGFTIQANTQTIELGIPSDFSGMYIIKIENEKGVVTKKFVKK